MKVLNARDKEIKLPAFFPDATSGVVRGVDSRDLEKANVDGIVVNTYHILRKDMVETIKRFGGIHRYMNLNMPIISDSGGFQVMSLIHNNNLLGKIEKNSITFKLDGEKHTLTPEKCIGIQLKLNSDIIMCLDDCTKPDLDKENQQESVERTISWAEKCKDEFERLTKNNNERPLLFSIIQGGNNKGLRKHCAKELLKIGFDGYSFGGWPIQDGKLMFNILEYTSRLIPDKYPKYAMGLGKPNDMVACSRIGYGIFDCVLPTRDARHERLYVFTKEPNKKNIAQKNFYEHMYIRKSHKSDNSPVSEFCDCHLCKNYSKSYLYNLFKLNDPLAIRLATIHNLRFYSKLAELLRP